MHFSTLSLFGSHSSLVHGIFNRHGGVGNAPFDTGNISYGVKDDKTHVQANRQKIKEAGQAHSGSVILRSCMYSGMTNEKSASLT